MGSCSILIPLINADKCPSDFVASCTENTVTTCEAGFLHHEDCGTLTCNLTTLTCEGCGDGTPTEPEECDDGNVVENDSCKNNCTLNVCGDGIEFTGTEECDDGNQTSGDGCENDCTLTPLVSCGNNVLDAGESCDDGNNVNGDGCSSNCQIEANCGNNIVEATEECDDGNLQSGDGCDNNCTDTDCGNGVVTNGEACDDGNLTNNDGCNSTCDAEPSLLCAQAIPVGDGSSTPGNNANGSSNFQVQIGDANLECFQGDGDGKEDLFSFTPPTDGQLFIAVTSQVDLVLYARSDCLDPDSELGCSDFDSGTEATDFGVSAGETITIFVDGFGFGQSDQGPYTLTVTLN
jgi:cysteine-rich repeat protein